MLEDYSVIIELLVFIILLIKILVIIQIKVDTVYVGIDNIDFKLIYHLCM